MKRHADLDTVTHALWQCAAEPMLRSLWGDPKLRIVRKLDAKAQALRRLPDTVALVESSDGMVIAHTEFEADPRAKGLPERMHGYGNLLYALNKYRYPVRSMVVVLGGTQKIPTTHRFEVNGQVRSMYRYEVFRLDQTPAALLASDPALAALTPLAKGATLGDVRRAVRCVQSSWPEVDAAEIIASLYITGGRQFGLPLIEKIIRAEELMLSPTYLAIIERGFEKGKRAGIERGIEKGLARSRALLARQVDLRFPGSHALDDLLPRCDADDLDVLAELMFRCESPEALREALLHQLKG